MNATSVENLLGTKVGKKDEKKNVQKNQCTAAGYTGLYDVDLDVNWVAYVTSCNK